MFCSHSPFITLSGIGFLLPDIEHKCNIVVIQSLLKSNTHDNSKNKIRF